MNTLVLTAHGSADPRAGANTRLVADQIRRLRPGLDVRVAFCERSAPLLCDVLPTAPDDSVVVPFLLADAYHAQVDIPAIITSSGARGVLQAGVLGEDGRLIGVLRERIGALGFSPSDRELGVIVAAVGSSREKANIATSTVARAVSQGTRWVPATTAFASGPLPTVEQAARRLRALGARRLVIAPWFLAPGVLSDRVAEHGRALDIPMAAPLGAHRLVAAAVLDRYDAAVARRGRLVA